MVSETNDTTPSYFLAQKYIQSALLLLLLSQPLVCFYKIKWLFFVAKIIRNGLY